jgi:hypothetical protein
VPRECRRRGGENGPFFPQLGIAVPFFLILGKGNGGFARFSIDFLDISTHLPTGLWRKF